MANNRSYFNNYKRPRYFKDPSSPRIASTWKYNGDDKSMWNFFIQKRNELFLKNGINYINDPAEIENRKREPLAARIIAVGLRENRDEENKRKIEQDHINRAYGKALEKWDKDKRLMEDHFGLAITLVAELCSGIIRSDLYSHINGSDFLNTNNEAKYEAVSKRLQTKYGPHNQGDVEALRNILITLNGDEMGWQRAMQIFDQTVTSMEITLQRNGRGELIHDEVPVIFPKRPHEDADEEEWEQYRFNLQDAVAEAKAAIGPPKNYRPSDMQLKEYLLEALRRSKISKYFKISDEAVLARNIQWTYQQIRQDVSDLADRDAQDSARHNNRGPHFDPDTIRLRSSNSSSASGYRTHRSHREYEGGRRYKDYKRPHSPSPHRHTSSYSQQRSRRPRSHSANQHQSHSVTFENRNCLNCGQEGHLAKDCPSLKCGECGDEFPTAELRRTHWGRNHSAHANILSHNIPDREGRRPSYSARQSAARSSRDRSVSSSRSRSVGRTPYRRANSAHSDDQSDYYNDSDVIEEF